MGNRWGVWGVRWSDPLELPILVNAGTEYYYTLQMLSNETMRNCLLNREPFLGCDQSWKVQGWLKNWIFCISFDTKF